MLLLYTILPIYVAAGRGSRGLALVPTRWIWMLCVYGFILGAGFAEVVLT